MTKVINATTGGSLWIIILATLTLPSFVERKKSSVRAGLIRPSHRDALLSLDDVADVAEASPQVMDTGVEFLVNYGKPDVRKEPDNSRNDQSSAHPPEEIFQLLLRKTSELGEDSDDSVGEVNEEEREIIAFRPGSSQPVATSRFPRRRRTMERQPSPLPLRRLIQFDRLPPLEGPSDYTIEDFQDSTSRPVAQPNKKSRVSEPTADDDEDDIYRKEQSSLIRGNDASSSAGRQHVNAVYSTSRLVNRPTLVRQDAFDMGDEDPDEVELERIRNSVDRLIRNKKRNKRARIVSLPADEDENSLDTFDHLDETPFLDHEDSLDYRVPVVNSRRARAQMARALDDDEVLEQTDNLFDKNADGATLVVAAPTSLPRQEEGVRLLRPKSLEEARILANTNPAAHLHRQSPVQFFLPETEDDDSEDDGDISYGKNQDQDADLSDISKELRMPGHAPRKRSEGPGSYNYENKQAHENEPDADDRFFYLPRPILDGDDDYPVNDDTTSGMDGRIVDNLAASFLTSRRQIRSAPFLVQQHYTGDDDDSDDDQMRQDELEEQEDKGEFDKDAARMALSAIEQLSEDDNVEPAIAARFRVCKMVQQTFLKDLAFTGRTLEVDECLVTCERKDGDRVFSHIFKLADWPCGKQSEGKCQRDGSCSAFF